jgi:prophage tail gpP-like protein
VYKFVGRLIDPRYFSETGEPTEAMMQLQERIQIARAEHQLKAKQRKEEREKKKKQKNAKASP